MLTDIRDFLHHNQQATLEQLSLKFNSQPSAIEGMLQVWIRKGLIAKATPDKCGDCCKCDSASKTYYYWKGAK